MITQSRNTGKVSNALSQVQGEFSKFSADKDAYSFSYLTLSGILEKALPILGKHNMSLVQGAKVIINDETPWVQITTRLSCEDEYFDNVLEFPMMEARKGMTEDMMLLGSSISYLRRYSIQLILGITGSEKEVEELNDENNNNTKGN